MHSPIRVPALIAAAAASFTLALATYLCGRYWVCSSSSHSNARSSNPCKQLAPRRKGVIEAIGNTPLIKLQSLSEATGCQILGKAEFLNPGGSVKDRVAVQIIEEGLQAGVLRIGGLVTEGSAGSTGVSLAMVASAYGCKCHVVIPDDAAIEKAQILEALDATVERVRPVSISHKDHFVNIAKRRAATAEASYRERSILCDSFDVSKAENGQIKEAVFKGEYGCAQTGVQEDAYKNTGQVLSHEKQSGNVQMGDKNTNSTYGAYDVSCKGGFFADQFENLANFRAHYQGTGPEIWCQTGGKVHAFVAAAGTGGTIAGVSRFLKEQDKSIKCFLIDPPGSGLFNRVTRGVMYTREEAEGKRLKNPFDTITEGIGINRLTQNFKLAQVDGAFRGTDREAVEMSRYLVKNEGLFLGSSSAMNCVGAVRVAQLLGPGHTIVTILCDSGMRHLSKFYNAEYIARMNLTPIAIGLEFLDHEE